MRDREMINKELTPDGASCWPAARASNIFRACTDQLICFSTHANARAPSAAKRHSCPVAGELNGDLTLEIQDI